MKGGPWRVVFLGTPQFGVPTLKALIEAGEDVAAVVTQPDRPRGRGQRVTPSPVKELALDSGIPVLQPVRLKDPEFMRALAAYQPEIMVVAAYGRILTHEMLALPRIAFLNVHASLLPKYRGSAPINWALIKGDEETGVTIMWVTYDVDTGPIFLQERVQIRPEDNTGTLYVKLAARGGALMVQALELLRQGKGIKLTQPEEGVSFAPPITPEMRHVDFQAPARDVAGLIRGLDPRPGAYGLLKGRHLKLFGARVRRSEGRRGAPGAVLKLTPQGLEIACGQGSVTVKELQLEGHKRLKAADFMRGHPLTGQVLE